MKRQVKVIIEIILIILSILLLSVTIKADSSLQTYSYTGGVQIFTAPKSGQYHIDMYGASGGGCYTSTLDSNGGHGGHTYGYINLNAGDMLYIQVGQAGSVGGGATYNGGGASSGGSGAGGGATSITKTNRGELVNFANYKGEVVAVAGGGGGKWSVTHGHNSIGSGGSTQGGATVSGPEGGQTYGYSFGKGQNSTTGGGAGGGGWYGGSASTENIRGGGGGSGYIGGLYNATTTYSSHNGNGTVTIKYISELTTSLKMNLGDGISYNGQSGSVTITKGYGEKINIDLDIVTGYAFNGWTVNSGDFSPTSSSFEFIFGDTSSEITANFVAPLFLYSSTEGMVNSNYLTLTYEENDNISKRIELLQSTNGTSWYSLTDMTSSAMSSLNKTFGYTGGVQTFTALVNGTYHFEARGAAGANGYNVSGGKGAIISGDINLNAGDVLYIYVGGQNGYNGGGSGTSGASYGSSGNGGGATTISRTSTILSSLGNPTNAAKYMLAVAGGGGGGGGAGSRGGSTTGYGVGGNSAQTGSSGAKGNSGQDSNTQVVMAGYGGGGASQTAAGGGGGTGTHHSHGADANYYAGGGGGGGGGWYGGGGGGGGYTDFGSSSSCYGYAGSSGGFGKGGNGGAGGYRGYCWHTGAGGGGGAGSSWTSSSVSNTTYTTNNSGNGYCSITFKKSGEVIGVNKFGVYVSDTIAPNKPNSTDITMVDDRIKLQWNEVTDNGLEYYFKAISYKVSDSSKIQESNIVKAKVLSGIKGYYYILDNSASTVTSSSCSFTRNSYTTITSSELRTYRYIHIAAVDYADNISTTYTFEIPLSVFIAYDRNDETINKYGDVVSTKASGDICAQEVIVNTTSSIKKNITSGSDIAYTKIGYTFTSWNTKADGTGATLNPGQSVSYDYLLNNHGQTFTLYAMWEPIKYNVNLYKNTPVDATHNVQYNSVSGWGDKGSYCTRQFTFDKEQLPNTNIYNLEGWSISNEWYSVQSGNNGGVTGTSFKAGEKSIYSIPNGTINLYAGCTKNKYTIVYSGNNTANNIYGDQVTTSFTGTTASTSCQYDTNVTLAKNGFSKVGYQFKEWNTKSDGTGTSYDQGQTLTKPNFVVTNNGSITLYAIWEPIRYTISFENNKGTHHTGSSDRDSTYRMSSVIDVRYDQYVTLPSNEYIRKYYVTLKNAEPWLTDLQAINGNTNSASAWVEYSFLGWKQGNALGSAPYYEVSSTDGLFTDRANLRNLTTTHKENVILYAAWKSNTMILPSTVAGQNDYVFLDWTDKVYGDTRIHDKNIDNNVDPVNAAIKKSSSYKPYSDITIYAHWYKDTELIFNLNGGNYRGSNAGIVLNGTRYDYTEKYQYDIIGSNTSATYGKYDTQQNQIDAYGTYNSNGENKLYTKVSSDGTYYRFLGWSLNPNATEPDSNFDVFNSSRKTTYNIKDNTVLYAVWEPVLQANIETNRTLGNLIFNDGTKPVVKLNKLNSSKGEQPMSVIIRPGEQGFYRIDSTGSNNLTFKIAFDTRITDIYTHGDPDSEWFDELNPLSYVEL